MVLVLVGGAVLADAVTRARVEERIAAEAVAGFGLSQRTRVEIAGTVFLPQVLAGSLQRVDVAAAEAVVGAVPMTDVAVSLRELSPSEPYTAGAVDFEGFVPLTAAQALAPEGVEVSLEDGRVVVSAQVLGLALKTVGTPVAESREVVARVESLRLGGVEVTLEDLPGAVAEAVREVRIPVDGLPQGMALTGVRVEAEGFRVTATGVDVVLQQR